MKPWTSKLPLSTADVTASEVSHSTFQMSSTIKVEFANWKGSCWGITYLRTSLQTEREAISCFLGDFQSNPAMRLLAYKHSLFWCLTMFQTEIYSYFWDCLILGSCAYGSSSNWNFGLFVCMPLLSPHLIWFNIFGLMSVFWWLGYIFRHICQINCNTVSPSKFDRQWDLRKERVLYLTLTWNCFIWLGVMSSSFSWSILTGS